MYIVLRFHFREIKLIKFWICVFSIKKRMKQKKNDAWRGTRNQNISKN